MSDKYSIVEVNKKTERAFLILPVKLYKNEKKKTHITYRYLFDRNMPFKRASKVN